MVYKKYIRRGNKVFGPYLYENYRVNGKTKTRYLGPAPKKKNLCGNCIFFIFFGIFIFGLIFFILYFVQPRFIGFFTEEEFKGISKSLNLEFTKSESYELDLENSGQLVSVKISGSVENLEINSKAKVYLDNFLILDASQKQEETSPSQETPSSEINITGFEFKSICMETCNLSSFNLNKSSYTIRVEISNPLTKIKIDEIEYEIIPFPISIKNETQIDIPEETNITTETNITKGNATISVIQYQAVLGQPVKWKKQITPETTGNLKVNLPGEAKNIEISKIKEEQRFSITGQAIRGENRGILGRLFRNIFSGFTGRAIEPIEEKVEIEIEIDELTEYEIEYETPAPYAEEREIGKGKEITVIGPDSVHYTNVLAFTDLEETHREKIRLYRTTDGIRELTQITNYIDSNNNGLIERIEWIVPSLSNQTYQLIIEITKAEHLDENRTFISDIYNEVKALDGIWSEEIPEGHYVRVTFEQSLDNTRDITIFPRIVSGEPRIEIYEIEGEEIVAEFRNINSNEYNKVFLTNLISESQDIFDLKILNGSLEFEHIFDPESFISIIYPPNNFITTNQNLNINYTFLEGVSIDSCWYSNDSYSVNITLSNCINITEVIWARGEHEVTIWANDTSGNVNSSSVSFRINTPPNVTSIDLFPNTVYVTNNLTCNFTIDDPDYVIIWSYQVRPTTSIIGGIFCDSDFCYSGANNGYFLKINKTSGEILWNQTGGPQIVMPSTSYVRSLDCDNYFCYGGDSGGYFLKVNKTSGEHIWNISEGYQVRPSVSSIYGLSCDSYFCYSGDVNGYFLKVNKTSGEHIWNISEGYQVRPTTADFTYAFGCDNDFCYGGDSQGYFLKVNKTSGEQIFNKSVGYRASISASTLTSLYCDNEFCYVGDLAGRFQKVNKTSGVNIWGNGVYPSRSGIYSLFCDNNFCYGGEVSDVFQGVGHFIKVNKTSGEHIWNISKGYQVRPRNAKIHRLYCDSEFCYGGDSNGYFTKVKKDGDLLSANVNWYKNNVLNLSYTIFDIFSESANITILDKGNLTKNDNWTCEIIPYDGYEYGLAVNSSSLIIENTVPSVNWIQINPPAYSSVSTSAYAFHTDPDSENATFYFQWYLNEINVENDTVKDVLPGDLAIAYLNSSKMPGDIINVSVYVNDGENNSSIVFSENIVWDTGDIKPGVDSIYSFGCDNDFCYGVGSGGYFLKVNKTSGEQIWNISEGYQARPSTTFIESLFCDNYFCYGGDGSGYFLKVNKTSGEILWNRTGGPQIVRPSSNSIKGVSCDNDFCYAGQSTGYFLKINKTSGEILWNQTGGPQIVRPSTSSINTIFCDNNFCYGGDYNGYLLKINKTSGEQIFNISQGYRLRLTTHSGGIYSLDCDNDFCYGGIYWGYIIKVNKTSGEILWNQTGGPQIVRPSTQIIYSLYSDNYFCYGGDGSGYFLKVNKTSGEILWNRTGGPQIVRPSTTRVYGLDCDNYFCYGGDYSGYFLKVLKSSNFTVELFPEIEFVSPTTSSGNTNQDYIIANVSFDNIAILVDTVNVTLYNSTGLVNSTISTNPSVNSFYVTFSDLDEGIYYLNATLVNIAGDWNLTETREINVKTSSPNVYVLSPEQNRYYNFSQIYFNITTNENSTAEYTLNNGLTNITMTANASGTGFYVLSNSLGDGNYTITFYVWDIFWNSNFTQSRNFTIDTIYPLIEFTTGTEETNTNFSRNWIFVNVSVVETNQANITFSLFNSIESSVNQTIFTDKRRTMNWTGLNDGLYYYNVTIFDKVNYFNSTETRIISIYTPTSSTPSPSSPSSGGSDGGTSTTDLTKNFSLSPKSIKVKVVQGESLYQNITLINTGKVSLNFTIDISMFERFVRLTETNFVLSPHQSKIISLEFFVNDYDVPDLYFGNITIEGDELKEEVYIDLEVISSKVLFDIKINIPEKHNYVMPGEKIIPKIEIYVLENFGEEIDILIEYKILDSKGKKIIEKNETVRILTNKSFVREIDIPANVELKEYVLYVKVTYEDRIGTSSVWFHVGERPILSLRNILISLGIILLLIFIVLFKVRTIKKRLKTAYKVNKSVIKSVLWRKKIIKGK